MKTILTCIISFYTYLSTGQKAESPFVTPLELRSFFNDARPIINGGKMYFYLSDKPLINSFPGKKKELRNFLKTYRLDSFFAKKDIDVLIKQINETRDMVWISAYIDSTKFLRSTYIDSNWRNPMDSIKKVYKIPVFYMLTFPLFDIEKQTCYISAWYWCGPLCGQGTTYIFKLVNGQWIPFRIYGGPVS